tara:strand:- start:3097 stop:3975 length:879 start_codon:yes stop_codon:yes gene_type:complete
MGKRFCYNCGKIGHVYTNCLNPVMSYGVILYKIRDGIPYYLMVQRSFTPDFKEIIRGRFDFDDIEYIKILLSRITLQEINFIYTYPHKILYQNIQKFCKVKKTRTYYEKYKQSRENYQKLIDGFINKDGITVKFSCLVQQNNPVYYLEPDWGFPKGRRNYKGAENDNDCAKREVLEETGIIPEHYSIEPEYYVTEVHVGSNNIKYAHRYYLGRCKDDVTCYIDPFNRHQVGEIRKLGWFTVEQALAMIRPYHIEKKKVLLRVHRKITGRVLVVDFTKNNQPITMDRAPIPVD